MWYLGCGRYSCTKAAEWREDISHDEVATTWQLVEGRRDSGNMHAKIERAAARRQKGWDVEESF